MLVAERGILMKKRGIFAVLFAGIMSVFAFKVIRNKRSKKKVTK